ncbi:MAG TPA: ATP-binding protein [Thermoanaerobaculia bacterium]
MILSHDETTAPRPRGQGLVLWICSRCGEDQVAFGPLPADLLCHTCHDAQRAANAFTQEDAGIPKLFRGLTRESWSAFFRRPWPEALESWTGTPDWVAIWGPTGTGKTALATVLLAEHLRTGRRGRWISGPELSHRLQRDFAAAEDILAPLLVTSLLVFDEPLTGAATDWYMERVLLITRTRDESCLPTIITSQLLPELLRNPTGATPPPLLSRWLSGLHIRTGGTDVRLRRKTR